MLWKRSECEKNCGDENHKAVIPNVKYVTTKQRQNMEYFNYLRSMITNDARYTRGIKSGITMEKAVFNKQKTSRLDLIFF